jgi:hypothetical protein
MFMPLLGRSYPSAAARRGGQGASTEPERLRGLRAVEVLEQAGGDEARRLLGNWRRGRAPPS